MTVYTCHGIGIDARFFDKLDIGPVVGVNMPGFGGEPLEGPTDFPSLAKGLAGKIDGAGHIMGHSMGGMVALELAATQPEKVQSLILCNTTPAFGGKDDTFKKQFVGARLAPLEAGKSMADLAADSVRSSSGADTAQADLDFMAALMAETPEGAYRAAIECLVTFDRRAALEGLTMPCLLIGGTDDQAAPARTMEKMAAKIPGAQLHILPGGHMTPVEHAAEVSEIVRTFLTEVKA